MARFVLVHGASSGGWSWDPLRERLEAAGHRVQAPDLPGSGADETPVAEVTLDACAARVCEALAASEEPAVLVGSSMGGIVITQAAARCPERVASLVYVAAFLPEHGERLIDLAQQPAGVPDGVQENAIVDGDPPVSRLPDEAAREVVYGCTDPEVIEWALQLRRPQPVAPVITPVELPTGSLEGIARRYVVATLDRAIPEPRQRWMLERAGCAEVAEIETDHVPQLSTPDELAAILGRFAEA